MKKINIFTLLITVIILFSSCSSIYDVPLETIEGTVGEDTDQIQEYYTQGGVYDAGNDYYGLLYEGCLIYIEKQTTIGQIGEKGADKIPVYGETTMQRIVKYNPVTGTVSSPCLDPNCNHSFESGCPMLLPQTNGRAGVYKFRGIFGDWLVIWTKLEHDEYRTVNDEILYNLKTGEVRRAYNEELGTEILTRWNGGSYYDGKYYRVKKILDYTDTGYQPGKENANIANYVPETKFILCEYDFEKDTTKELFEIPTDYNISKITNKRFFFGKSTGDGVKLSCNKDGSNMKEEPTHDLGTSNMIGTYTIDFIDNGFAVHDLVTDEIKTVNYDFTMHTVCCVTDTGILVDKQTAYDEWYNFDPKEYRAEHPGATVEEINAEAARIMSTGNAQIWKSGFMGEDLHMIYEKENAYIETIAASGDYIFVTMITYTPERYQNPNGGRCVINIKTGEITEIPFLDIVVPDEYLK